MENEEEAVECEIKWTVYRNDENGFSILSCALKGDYGDFVTLKGCCEEFEPGTVIRAYGRWEIDPRHGEQFAFDKYEQVMPSTLEGMIEYLKGARIRHIGKRRATLIVQRFGEKTFDVLDNDPERLLEIRGISKKNLEDIKSDWADKMEMRNLIVFLQTYGVSPSHAPRIYAIYGKESMNRIKRNPYDLAEDVPGIGFKTADAMAEKLGIDRESEMRIRSGINFTLWQLSNDGHCFATREQLVPVAAELLCVEPELVAGSLQHMIDSGALAYEDEAVYLKPFYAAECGCARRFSELLSAPKGATINAKKAAEDVRRDGAVDYDPAQILAIETAVRSKIMVLTGGPGTGKTTAILGIISAYKGAKVLLAAPTGRAAKRMSEATGMEAKTIHRLLEYNVSGFQRNRDNRLEGDVLILDECSMIDVQLMYALLQALPDTMTLVMVGDADQLPSVGAGNVLRDVIRSDAVPVVELKHIFRQARESRIVTNAHLINEGKMPDMSGGDDSDFFFAQKKTQEQMADFVVRYCKTNIPQRFKVDPMRDIQVLAPMKKGVCGTDNLNRLLQEALNPETRSVSRGGTTFKVGDRVIQTENDYDRDVFNGDIGIVEDIDREEGFMSVDFYGRCVVYELSNLSKLSLAYAITVHKSQGSEYPVVVMPLCMGHYKMLQRNLLYTAVTRAKKLLVMVGEKAAVSRAVSNYDPAARNTRLAERLNLLLGDQYSRPPEGGEGDADGETEEETKYKGSEDIFARLSRSAFRSKFHLAEDDRRYIEEKGMDTIRAHAESFVNSRLAPASIPNDGKQTPMRGHPVFKAQHATATCCRDCLFKWHGIPKGRALTDDEKSYVVDTIMEWIERETKNG